MKILLDGNNVVIHISENAQLVENGIDVGGLVYGDKTLQIIEVESVPEAVLPQKYCYTVGSGFYLNSGYVEYIGPEQKVSQLEAQVALMQVALDELILGGAL